jgi:cell division protein FtsI (penicillin-binding protein 3)
VHPGHDLASGVLGFTDIDGTGRMGVELAYDHVLAGVPGEMAAQFDAYGRVIPTGDDRRRDPVAGRDVVLTLDRDLQWYAQRLIADQVAATHAKNGTVVVMDVKTGELLALATAPTFDPDHLTAKDGDRLINPAISDVYEPGSVNKVITAAAALEAGVVTPMSVVDVPSTYRVANHTLHDAEKHGLEHLTFAGVLAKSSNIGTVKVAQRVGPDRLYSMMRSFGFGEKAGIELPGDSRGLLPKPADWSATSIGTIPIGQGISVSALQVASVYATIANGGVRVAPTIVKAIRDNAGHVTPAPAPAQRRVVTPVVAAQIRTMLESVVSEQGTAPKAAIPGYRVAGKTGTAQRVATSGPRQGHYDGTYTSSFIGMAPADAPRFVTAVVLQGTGSHGHFGGLVAAPVFSQVMGFALRSYDVAPTGTRPHPFRLEAE